MNADVKQKWVEALRSGKFKQGRCHLKWEADDGMRHCCLGVLCELYVEVTDHAEWVPDPNSLIKNQILDDHNGTLPPDVQQWADLPINDPHLLAQPYNKPDADYHFITELNDNLNYDFKQLAELIEKQL